jgi:outer membrane biosynthesis protein TonB
MASTTPLTRTNGVHPLQAPDYHVPPPQKPAAQEPAPAPVPNAAPAPQPAPAQAPQPTSPPVAAAEPDRRAHKHVSVVRSSKFRHVAGALRHKNCNIEGISGLQAALPAESNVLAVCVLVP